MRPFICLFLSLLVLFFHDEKSSVGAVSTGYQNGSPWPNSRGFSNNNTGTSPYVGSQYSQEKWEYYFGGVFSSMYPQYTSSPIIGADGTVYVSMPSGVFYAMSSQGTMKWSFNHGSSLTCPAFASNGGGGFYNGYSSPVIDSSGTIYMTTLCSLYALSSTTGAMLWSLSVTGSNIFISSPVVDTNNVIYVASSSPLNSLTAVSSTGTVLWNATIATPGSIPPCVGCINNPGNNLLPSPAIGSDGTIYFTWISNNPPGGMRGYGLYAMTSTGSFKWYNNLMNSGSNYFSNVVIGPDGTIYVNNDDMTTLYAVTTYGSIKWSWNERPTTNSGSTNIMMRNSPAVFTDGTIYVSFTLQGNYNTMINGMTQNYQTTSFAVYALYPYGSIKWNVTMTPSFSNSGNMAMSSPTIDAAGTVYAGSFDNKLYAISASGSVKWYFSTGGQNIASSPAIGADGTIYVTSDDVTLHAINICPAGTYGSNTLPCVSCPSGTFSSSMGSSACTTCPAGQCALSGSAFCVPCGTGSTCQAGQYSDLAFPSVCTPCPAGQFSTVVGAVGYSACAACPLNSFSSTAGSTSCQTCLSGTTRTGTSTCSFPYQENAPWPHAHGISNNNTNLSPYVGTQRASVKWSYQTDSSIATSTAQFFSATAIDSAGNLYYTRLYSMSSMGAGGIYYQSCVLFCVSPTGAVNWYYNILTPSASSSTPTLAADGTVYVTSGGSFYAFTSAGSLKWSHIADTSGSMSGALIGYDGTLYVATNLRLLAVAPQGYIIWRYRFPISTTTSNGMIAKSYLTIGARGTLYVCTALKQLYAFSASTGSVKWVVTPPTNPAFSFPGYLPTMPMSITSPTIGPNKIVYYSTSDWMLYAVSGSGSVWWNITMSGTSSPVSGSQLSNIAQASSPAIGPDGTVYVTATSFSSYSSRMYAVTAAGSVKWTFTTGVPSSTCGTSSNSKPPSPAVGADGTVYIGFNDYNFYAFTPSGSVLFKYSGGLPPTGSSTCANNLHVYQAASIAADGTVYVNTNYETSYAFNLCPAGQLPLKVGCVGCGSGTYSSVAGASVCLSCPAGTYNAAIGASACTPCPAGQYGITSGSYSPSACISCPSGQYSSVVGASSSSACSACPSGTYSVGNTCVSCPNGQYNPTAGSTQCVACPAGQFSVSLSTAVGSSSCQKCAPGTYASTPNSASCLFCPSGTFSQTGSSTCNSCPTGSYSFAMSGNCTLCS